MVHRILLLVFFNLISTVGFTQLKIKGDRYNVIIGNSYDHSITVDAIKGKKNILEKENIGRGNSTGFCGNFSYSELSKIDIIPYYTEANYNKDILIASKDLSEALSKISVAEAQYIQDNINKAIIYAGLVATENETHNSENLFGNLLNWGAKFGLNITDFAINIESYIEDLNTLDGIYNKSKNFKSFIDNLVSEVTIIIEDKQKEEGVIALIRMIGKEVGLNTVNSERLSNHIVYRVKNHLKLVSYFEDLRKHYRNQYEQREKQLQALINNPEITKTGKINLKKEYVNNYLSLSKRSSSFEVQCLPIVVSSNYNQFWVKRADPFLSKNGSDELVLGKGLFNGTLGLNVLVGLGKEQIFSKYYNCSPKKFGRFYLDLSYFRRDYTAVDSLIGAVDQGYFEKSEPTTGTINYNGDILLNKYNIGAGLRYRFHFNDFYFDIGSRYTMHTAFLDFTKSEIMTQGVKWKYDKFSLKDRTFSPVYNLGIGYNGTRGGSLIISADLYKGYLSNKTDLSFGKNTAPVEFDSQKYIFNISFGFRLRLM